MSVTKNYLNKKKTKFNWRAIAYIPTGEYDRFGKPKMKHKHIGYYATKSEGEVAERNFWNEFEACVLELNKDATFKDVFIYFLGYAKNEGRYAKGTISNYEGYFNNHFQMLQHIPIKNFTPALIQKWRRELYLKGASDHIFNSCIKLAKAAFNYAIKLKQVNTNPFKDIKSVPIPPKLRNRFSTEELKKVIHYLT